MDQIWKFLELLLAAAVGFTVLVAVVICGQAYVVPDWGRRRRGAFVRALRSFGYPEPGDPAPPEPHLEVTERREVAVLEELAAWEDEEDDDGPLLRAALRLQGVAVTASAVEMLRAEKERLAVREVERVAAWTDSRRGFDAMLRGWQWQMALSSARLFGSGLARTALPVARRLGGRAVAWTGFGALVATALGVLVFPLTPGWRRDGGHASSWLGFVGGSATVGAAVALFAVLMAEMVVVIRETVALGRLDPVVRRRYLVLLAVTAVIVVGNGLAMAYGWWGSLMAWEAAVLDRVDASSDARVSGAAVGVLLLFMAVFGLRTALRGRRWALSERVERATSAVALGLMGIAISVVGWPVARVAVVCLGGAVVVVAICGAAMSAVIRYREHRARVRFVERAGVAVDRGLFRWWILAAAAAAPFMADVCANAFDRWELPPSVPLAVSVAVVLVEMTVLLALSLGAMVLGAVQVLAGWRYTRRVRRAYEDLLRVPTYSVEPPQREDSGFPPRP